MNLEIQCLLQPATSIWISIYYIIEDVFKDSSLVEYVVKTEAGPVVKTVVANKQ